MIHRPLISWTLLLLLAGSVQSSATEVLDRIVATVNGHTLLQSDLDDEVGYECFMSGRETSDFSTNDRKGALNRLVDQELLKEQMHSSDFKPASADDVGKQMEALKADYAHEHSGQSWDSSLASYRIDEALVREHVALELNQLRLVESRLRPSIQVDSAAVEQYYRQQLVPKLSGKQISLSEAAPKIREILVEERLNESLETWLDSLRSQAQIRVLSPELSTSESSER